MLYIVNKYIDKYNVYTGYSDSRWNEYNDGNGLSYYVHFFNVVDGGGGIILLLISAYLLYVKTFVNKKYQKNGLINGNVLYILVLLFRDACLWRETIDYMFDQHLNEYPFTLSEPKYLRNHAIIALWSVNLMWLVVPPFTVVWAFQQFTSLLKEKQINVGKKRQ